MWTDSSPEEAGQVIAQNVSAMDLDGIDDVVSSQVEIEQTGAIPNPVAVGQKALLSARVRLISPRHIDYAGAQLYSNRIEKVTVDITDLFGVDCRWDQDRILIEEMTGPDGDGVYTHGVSIAVGEPETYRLPVVAVDSLGHEDNALLTVNVVENPIEPGDVDANGNLDITDALLALQAAMGMMINHSETHLHITIIPRYQLASIARRYGTRGHNLTRPNPATRPSRKTILSLILWPTAMLSQLAVFAAASVVSGENRLLLFESRLAADA